MDILSLESYTKPISTLSVFSHIPPRRKDGKEMSYFSNESKAPEVFTYDRLFHLPEGYDNKLHRDDREHSKGRGLDLFKETTTKKRTLAVPDWNSCSSSLVLQVHSLKGNIIWPPPLVIERAGARTIQEAFQHWITFFSLKERLKRRCPELCQFDPRQCMAGGHLPFFTNQGGSMTVLRLYKWNSVGKTAFHETWQRDTDQSFQFERVTSRDGARKSGPDQTRFGIYRDPSINKLLAYRASYRV